MRVLSIAIALTATLSITQAEAGKRHYVDGNGNRGYCLRSGGSVAVEPLVAPLREKVREIVAACGSRVVSTGCRGGVTPNHRQWKAADLDGNPSCIYAHLRGWPGGYSTDYKRVRHVHISYNPKHEWGLRFAHGGSSTSMSAKRGRKSRVATASVQPVQVGRDFNIH